MKLIEQIRADRIVAFKAKENIRKNILGCLISEACKEDKEPSDQTVLKTIKKFIEGAKIVQENCNERDYEFYQANIEIGVLETYRPKQMIDSEIETLIKDWNAVNPNLNLKEVMVRFKENFEGQYDGKLVSEIAKKVL